MLFVAFLLVRRLVLRGSAHYTHGALQVLVVVVALIAVAGLRLYASRR
jgi:hypothetical protein